MVKIGGKNSKTGSTRAEAAPTPAAAVKEGGGGGGAAHVGEYWIADTETTMRLWCM
jgi:hypothetical protein